MSTKTLCRRNSNSIFSASGSEFDRKFRSGSVYFRIVAAAATWTGRSGAERLSSRVLYARFARPLLSISAVISAWQILTAFTLVEFPAVTGENPASRRACFAPRFFKSEFFKITFRCGVKMQGILFIYHVFFYLSSFFSFLLFLEDKNLFLGRQKYRHSWTPWPPPWCVCRYVCVCVGYTYMP